MKIHEIVLSEDQIDEIICGLRTRYHQEMYAENKGEAEWIDKLIENIKMQAGRKCKYEIKVF